MDDIEKIKLRELYTRRGHLRIRLRHEAVPSERKRLTALLQTVESAINGLDGGRTLTTR